MTKLPQCIVNVRHENLNSVLNTSAVKQAVADIEEQLGVSGRFVLRKSGTEPLIHVMIESMNAELSNDLANKLAQIIKEN
ncbi:hypothetical protein [Alteromonas sp. A079]|uniref:hypothetical protein n=1 Tax=Alteromonas sp. A079 TaxID=3410268 RepID=UPI003BA34996